MDYYAKHVQESNEDIETRKPRDIALSLTDKQLSNLKLLAYKAGFASAGELLESFVGDLTEWHSNGSDERECADKWFNRAFGSSDYYSNFRYHLFNYDYTISDMQDMLDDEEFFEEVYSDYVAETPSKTNETKEACLSLLKNLIQKGEEL